MQNFREQWLPLYSGSCLDEFIDIYSDRPIRSNIGGVGINHSYALFFALRQLKPSFVIESGVFKGQTTWIIEQAAPEAKIFSLDPCPDLKVYTSRKVTYITEDFAGIDWTELDVDNTLCFFDDHQSALSRLKDMKWWGFKHAVFEDNYPVGEGDCYSLRKIFAGKGHPRLNLSTEINRSILKRIAKKILGKDFGIYGNVDVKNLNDIYWRQEIIRNANGIDKISADKNISVYHEFQPLLINSVQRWGNRPWEGEFSLLAKPVFASLGESKALRNCLSEMNEDELIKELGYNYICYVNLN